MTTIDRVLLVRLMAAMAAGDQAALFPFFEEFGDRLRGTVRSSLRSLQRHDVAANPEDVHHLALDAAMIIFDRAASWNPDGALPWTWARRAIHAEVVRFLGHPSVDITELGLENHEAPTALGTDVDLRVLAADHDGLALLVQALTEIASDRDADVHLQFQTQKVLGDPSPAHTVADLSDLSPANVRQINNRVRRKLSALAARNPTFAALTDLSWVDLCGRVASSPQMSPRTVELGRLRDRGRRGAGGRRGESGLSRLSPTTSL